MEDKKVFREEAEKAGIQIPAGLNLNLNELTEKKWDQLKQKYGERLVFQLTDYSTGGGQGTFFVNDKKVNYAVMETGLGGKYDGTNVVSRSDKLSVITKIGLDHTNILGKMIEEITLQKAMIINENSQAISIYQEPKAEKVIREVAENKQANIMFVKLVGNGLKPFRTDRLNLIGDYQKENASLALATVEYLSQRDGFEINKEKVGAVFQTAHFPGRFDIKKITNKIVVFDGAHNPQKMKAFVSSLIKEFPNKKFNFLLAFKKGKDYQDMLKIIISLVGTSKIILTSFFVENQDMINASEDPAEIGRGIARDARTGINFEIIPDLKEAWETILKEDGLIVVTGSLYLVGEIFRLIRANK